MPNPPRLTAADAETLLVSAGFLFLERSGQHRIYGRDRTRVVVPFDGRVVLHPKLVRGIVEGIEHSRPTPGFEVDKTIVGTPPVGSATANPGAWATETPELATQPPAAAAPVAAKPSAPAPSETVTIPPTPVGRAADATSAQEESIDLPRRPKPKGAWS